MTRIKRGAIIAGVLLGVLAVLWIRSNAQGGDLRYGDTVTGTLAAGASDVWHFTATAGDVIAVQVERTGGGLEPTLLLENSAEQPVVATQAPSGQSAISLSQITLVRSGSYLLKIGGVNQTSGGYRLTVALSKAAPVMPTSTPRIATASEAGPIAYGTTVEGEIQGLTFSQAWRFRGAFGDVLDIRMAAKSSNLRPVVALISPLGDALTSVEAAPGSSEAAIQAFQLPFTGDYTILARRAGANGGQSGTSNGQYSLTLSPRGPGTAAQNTLLNPGTIIQGRLTTDVPLAIYRMDVGGLITARLTLSSQHRLASMRFISTNGDILASFRGESPLTIATRLPDKGPFLIEVGSETYENRPFTDFGLAYFRLSGSVNSAIPLRLGERRRNAASTTDRSFFIGQANDMMQVEVVPDVVALNATVRVIGPQDVLLLKATVGPGLSQVLTLPENGPYEIDVRTTDDVPLSLETVVSRIGANGTAFGRYAFAADRGALVVNTPVNGKLTSGGTDAWWLDGQAGQMINLNATPTSNGFLPGIALQRPDGSLQDAQVSETAQGVMIQQALLAQNGRYRVVIFDSHGADGGLYALRYEEVSGGELQAGEMVKGLLSPASGLASWSLDVAAGALINSRLTTLTPKAWVPTLQITDPTGQIIAGKSLGEKAASVDLPGVVAPVSGKYRLLVAGTVTDALASYQLVANVQTPFAANSAGPIQVNTIRTWTGRYTAAPTLEPVQRNPADLINPGINAKAILGTAQPLTNGSTVRGEIITGTVAQAWRIEAIRDTSLILQATALAGTIGPNLLLLDKDGKVVNEQLRSDDPTTTLTYHIPQNGIYTVVVRLGLIGGRYLLSLNTANLVTGPLQIATGKALAYGQSVAGELLNGSDEDTYYFLGTANDLVSVQVMRTAGDLIPGLELRSPRGITLVEQANGDGNTSLAISNYRLAESGIFTLAVRHGEKTSSTSGRYFLFFDGGTRAQSRGGGVISRGTPVNGYLVNTKNDETWLFEAHSGEQVSFVVRGIGAQFPAPLGLRLQDTAGRTFASQDVALTQSDVRLSRIMLPADGVYRIQVVGGGQTTGAYTLLWEPERERLRPGPLAFGQTANGVFSTNRNVDTWVFSGTAGDIVSVAMRYQLGDPFSGGFRISAENGVPLVTVPDVGDGSGARVDSLLLPFSGSYTIVVANPKADFKGFGVYSLSLSLQDSKARSMGAPLRYGQSGHGSISTADPEDSWVVSAQAGDIIRVNVKALDQYLKPTIELRTPQGVILASVLANETDQRANVTLDKFTIPGTGVYVIRINGGLKATSGAYGVTVESLPLPVAAAETIRYGDTKEGLIADDRLNQTRAFTAKQGDRITARMTREPGSSLAPILELRLPNGTLLARTDAAGQESADLVDVILPESGQYTLVTSRYLGAQGTTSGRYKLSLSGTPAEHPIKGIVKYGQLAIGRLDDATPADRLNFQGKKGDVIGIVSRAKSGNLDTFLTLENSAGAVLATNDDADGTDAGIAGAVLPADDTYTVILSRVGNGVVGSSGNYELFVNLLYRATELPVPQALLSYGERVVGTVDSRNQEMRYAFSGNQDDEIALQLIHQADDAPPFLTLMDPAGTTLASGVFGVGQTTVDRYRLPATGLYYVLIKRPANTQLQYSPYALTLTLLTGVGGQSSGGVLQISNAVTGAFSPGSAAHYWLFRGRSGQVLSLSLLQLTGNLHASAIVLGPNGQSLASGAVPDRGQATSLDRINLPADGVYSILVLPGGSNRGGQYRLTVQPNSAALPAPAALIPNQVFGGTLSATQPEERWSFNGQKGQSISVRVAVTDGNLRPRILVLGPQQNVLADRQPGTEDNTSVAQTALANFVLPDSGTYTVIITQQRGVPAAVGTYQLSMAIGALSQDAVLAAPVAYGQAVSKLIQQGTDDQWAFVGATGDAVNISVVADSSVPANKAGGGSGKAPTLTLVDVSGAVLAQATSESPGETLLGGVLLPASGRYVVRLSAPETTSYTLVVQRRQSLVSTSAAAARPLTIDRPLDSTIAARDSIDLWAYNGKAGSIIQISGVRLSGDVRLDMTLLGQSGYITSVTAGPDSPNVTLGPVRLPEDGTYALVVTRALGTSTKTNGRYSVRLTNAPAAANGGGLIPVYGLAVTGAIAGENSTENWTFNGNAGDIVNLHMVRLDGDLQPMLRLTAPGASGDVTTGANDKGDLALNGIVLPVTGLYKLAAAGQGKTSGGYRLIVERPQTALQASIRSAEGINLGDQKQANLSASEPLHAWVFFAHAADSISVEVRPATGSPLDPFVYLLSPDGSVLASADSGGSGGSELIARLSSIYLPKDGFYGIVVRASPLCTEQGCSGAATVRLDRSQPGAVYQGRLLVGQEQQGTLTDVQPLQEWLVQADAPRPFVVTLTSESASFKGTVSIVRTDGQVLIGPLTALDGQLSADFNAPTAGEYSLLVAAEGRGVTGQYQIKIDAAVSGK